MFSIFYVLLLLLSSFAVSYGTTVPTTVLTTVAPCYGSVSTTGWYDVGYHYYYDHGTWYKYYHNLTMFFTPSRPGSQRIQVSKDGVVLDPHYNFTNSDFIVHDVTERDDGRFSVLRDGVSKDVLTLEVRDCAEKVDVLYGDTYNFTSPYFRHVYTLHFARQWYLDGPAVLLWNRTGNPQAAGGRRMGRLVDNQPSQWDKWMIENATQSEHSGYYTFRDKNGKLTFRRKMVVEAMHEYHHTLNGGEFIFTIERAPDALDMTFTPLYGGAERVMMRGGETVTDWEWVFDGRMSMQRSFARRLLQVRIRDVRPSDAGLLQIRDQHGNMALVVVLDTPGGGSYSSHEISIGVGVAVAILLVLVVCCLGVRKHRNKSRKTNNSAPLNEAAAEAVSFTDFQDSAQPSTSAHPSSSHGPSRPTYPASLSPKEPGSTGHRPLFQAPGPVQSISASGLPVFIHPTTHF